MIQLSEIAERASEWHLPQETVEKDYVLGWLLAGLAQHTETSTNWVFKGGTCLKKCYFETYRFSEDLDFTLRDSALYEAEGLRAVLREVCAWVGHESGIHLPAEVQRLEASVNKQGKLTFQGRIYYRAAIRRQPSQLLKIKLDLTQYERLVTEPIRRVVFHSYSDAQIDVEILACTMEELTAEKVRALFERTRARDLYDVVHLLRRAGSDFRVEQVREILRLKCEYKGLVFPSVAALRESERMEEFRAQWDGMLRHQVPVLPKFEDVWSELPELLAWLEVGAPSSQPVLIPIAEEKAEQLVPRGGMRAWHVGLPLDLIRSSGANRLCVKLTYSGKVRIVEPYSLRKSQAGLSFVGWEREENHIKRFRIDRIQAVEATDISFRPRYAIEF